MSEHGQAASLLLDGQWTEHHRGLLCLPEAQSGILRLNGPRLAVYSCLCLRIQSVRNSVCVYETFKTYETSHLLVLFTHCHSARSGNLNFVLTICRLLPGEVTDFKL